MKSGRKRWTGHVARTGEKRHKYRVLAGKPEKKRQLGVLHTEGRPTLKLKNNTKIKMLLKGIG
jgi:hypothetical protein